jgi:thiamine-monophosphate kinase
VPLSDAARLAGPDWHVTCLTGGDDYELLLAVPPDRSQALQHEASRAGIPVTRIGHFHSGPPEVMVRQASGEPLALTKGGWSHF